MSKIQLHFKSITQIVGSERLGLIILVDNEERRQISIVCDKAIQSQFVMRMNGIPVASRLCPEVLLSIIGTETVDCMEINIVGIANGQYTTVITNSTTYSEVPIRASDAILIAYIAHIPIYIDENLMAAQSVPFKVGSCGLSVPINAINDEMLQSAMEKAVNEENYELASRLRDEIKRRKHGTECQTRQETPEE